MQPQPKENLPGILVLLFGLPASGKSALARAIRSLASADTSVVIISYDEHLSLLKPPDQTFSPAMWKRNRDACLDLSKSHLRSQLAPGVCRRLVILDDNMQFYSMRKEAYNIAREVRCAFVQVHISCPVDLCLERNMIRAAELQVMDSVIQKMHGAFDAPRPEVHPWEANTIAVDTQSLRMDSDGISRIFNQILEASSVPPLLPETTVDLTRSRHVDGQKSNQESVAHMYDRWSRNILSKTMKILRDKQVEDASVGKKLNAERRLGLDALRAAALSSSSHACMKTMLVPTQEKFVLFCNQAIGAEVFDDTDL